VLYSCNSLRTLYAYCGVCGTRSSAVFLCSLYQTGCSWTMTESDGAGSGAGQKLLQEWDTGAGVEQGRTISLQQLQRMPWPFLIPFRSTCTINTTGKQHNRNRHKLNSSSRSIAAATTSRINTSLAAAPQLQKPGSSDRGWTEGGTAHVQEEQQGGI